MNPILQIEISNGDRLDVKVKGDRHQVIEMIIEAMNQHNEVADALMNAAATFVERKKGFHIIQPHRFPNNFQ